MRTFIVGLLCALSYAQTGSSDFEHLWVNITSGGCTNHLTTSTCEQAATALNYAFATEEDGQWPVGCYMYSHKGRKEIYYNIVGEESFNTKDCGSSQVGMCFCPNNNIWMDCYPSCPDEGVETCDWCGYSDAAAPMICCHEGMNNNKKTLQCTDAIFNTTGTNATATPSGYQCVVQPDWEPEPEIEFIQPCNRGQCMTKGRPASLCCGVPSESSCSSGFEFSAIDSAVCEHYPGQRGICCTLSSEHELNKDELELEEVMQCVNDDRIRDKEGQTCSDWYDQHPEDCGDWDWEYFIAHTRCCTCKDNLVDYHSNTDDESIVEFGLGIGISVLLLFMFFIIYQAHMSFQTPADPSSEGKKRREKGRPRKRQGPNDEIPPDAAEMEPAKVDDCMIDIVIKRNKSSSSIIPAIELPSFNPVRHRSPSTSVSQLDHSLMQNLSCSLKREPTRSNVLNVLSSPPDENDKKQPNITETVKNLKATYEMYKIGALTDDEFQTVKDKILLYE